MKDIMRSVDIILKKMHEKVIQESKVLTEKISSREESLAVDKREERSDLGADHVFIGSVYR